MARKRILVPIDFSAQSDAALFYARKIARDMNMMISCMYVIEEHVKISDLLTLQEIKHRMRREAEQKLSGRVNSILKKEDNIEFEIIVSSGNISKKILEKAIDLDVQLIILGKPNSGATIKQIVAKAKVPVIIIPDKKNLDRENIILPLELFKPIGVQIKCAIEVALRTQARVLVISVVECGMSDLISVYRNRLKEIKLLLNDLKIPCYTQLLVNTTSVSKEIISFSRWVDKSFILLMTRNETDHTGRYVGATALEIIENSKVPVQCIHPHSFTGISGEDAQHILKTNPLAGFILKGHLINDQAES